MFTIIAALILILGAEPKDDFDPRTIPAADRLAYFNKLADWNTGPNSLEFYEQAKAALEEAEGERIPDEQARKEWIWFLDNSKVLLLRTDWPEPHEPHVVAWLQQCRPCLKALKAATDCQRFYAPWESDSGRLADAITSSWGGTQHRFARLLGCEAMRLARAGKWQSAYEANARLLRIASHAAQSPTKLSQLLGGQIAGQIAAGQLGVFLHEHPPDDPGALLKRWRALADQRVSDALIAKSEALFWFDHAAMQYEWAADESTHPGLAKQIESWLSVCDSGDLRIKTRPFKSVADYRAALRKHSLDKSWETYQKEGSILRPWDDRPLREFLAKREELAKEVDRLWGDDPVVRLYGDLFPFGNYPTVRALYTNARLSGEILLSLHAYRAAKGRWPTALGDLVPDYFDKLPVDEFADGPFHYELTDGGKSFRLYSIGPDLKDDGGKPGQGTGVDTKGDLVYWPPPPPPEYR